MDTSRTKISLELPGEIRSILTEKSLLSGMDESSYAAMVIIDYLRGLGGKRPDDRDDELRD
jgi:hypothetical protein